MVLPASTQYRVSRWFPATKSPLHLHDGGVPERGKQQIPLNLHKLIGLTPRIPKESAGQQNGAPTMSGGNVR